MKNNLRQSDAGYTLIELAMVTAILAMVMALALPSILPAFAFSQLEGAARHVSSYGRAVIAQAAFNGDHLTVRIDMEGGEYWSVKWRDTTRDFFEDGDDQEEDQEVATIEDLLAMESGQDPLAIAQQTAEMEMQFERYFRRALESQARNVRHEGILSEIGPLFEEDFRLREEDEDTKESSAQLLLRTALPDSVRFESIRVGTTEYFKGIVEIDVSPLGLAEPVTFYLVRDEDEYYTIIWDPITNSSRIRRGKELAT